MHNIMGFYVLLFILGILYSYIFFIQYIFTYKYRYFLFNHEKEGNPAIFGNTDGSGGRYAK